MSSPLTLARILEAAERVRRSPRYYNIVKNTRRLAVLEVEGELEFVSAGFLTAELDTPGYAERHKKHSPRQEGPLLTRESDLLAAGLREIDPDHPDFPEWLDTYLSETAARFRLDAKWRRTRVHQGRDRDFVFFVPA